MGYIDLDGVEWPKTEDEYVLEIITELQAKERKIYKNIKKLWRKLSKKERRQIMVYCDDVRVDIQDELAAMEAEATEGDTHIHLHLDEHGSLTDAYCSPQGGVNARRGRDSPAEG